MRSKTPTPKITELSDELDGLKNPTDRPPSDTPRELVQIVDKSRLLAAWQSNINTLRGVLRQLSVAERTSFLTRILMLVSVMLNVALLTFVVIQLDQIGILVRRLEATITAHSKLEPGPHSEP